MASITTCTQRTHMKKTCEQILYHIYLRTHHNDLPMWHIATSVYNKEFGSWSFSQNECQESGDTGQYCTSFVVKDLADVGIIRWRIPAATWGASFRSSPCRHRNSPSRWTWRSCLLSGSWAALHEAGLKPRKARKRVVTKCLKQTQHIGFLVGI